MTTRMVSPKPISGFASDFAAIAFPVPVAISRGWQNVFPRANRWWFRALELVLILMLRANCGASRNSLRLDVFGKNRLGLSRSRSGVVGRFRRLFAAAQSTARAKLANPLVGRMIFSSARAARMGQTWRLGFGRDDGRNYDKSLRQRPVVGDAEVDPRLIAIRRQRLEPGQRAARQSHGRAATGQVDHPHVPPPDAMPYPGAE